MARKITQDLGAPASVLLPGKSNVIRLKTNRSASDAADKSSAPTITKANLHRMVCPVGKGEAFFWDAEVRGLGLRAYASGKRAWLVQYRDGNARTRRIVLGDVSAIDPAAARELARGTLLKVAAGANPSADRKAARQAQNVGELVTDYLTFAERSQKASTYDQTKRNLKRYALPLHSEAVAAVGKATITRLLLKIGSESGPVQANRVQASLSAMWSWGMRQGFIGGHENPCARIKADRNPEKPRERVLSPDELRLIWRATEGEATYSRLVRVLMLTACRRAEIGGMEWREISGDVLTIPAARMKGGKAHEVFLTALALASLPPKVKDTDSGSVFGTGDGGFQGWSAGKSRLDGTVAVLRAQDAGVVLPENAEGRAKALEAFALPSWGLHDFRRTFSTVMNDNLLANHRVIEAVLAHVGSKEGVAGTYNRADYHEQKRAAMVAWSNYLQGVTRLLLKNDLVLR